MSVTFRLQRSGRPTDVGEIERKMLMASSETYLLYFVPLVVTTIHHASSPRDQGSFTPLLWIQTSWNEHIHSTASHVLPQLAFFFTTFQVPNMPLTLKLKHSHVFFLASTLTYSKYWYGLLFCIPTRRQDELNSNCSQQILNFL